MKQIVLIAGSSHTGKTALAQKVLERYGYPYLSIDHLKMGLIRSGYCPLTPESDDADLTAYLWPIVREIIKTAIENHQRLVVEGCYIPSITAPLLKAGTWSRFNLSACVSAKRILRNIST